MVIVFSSSGPNFHSEDHDHMCSKSSWGDLGHGHRLFSSFHALWCRACLVHRISHSLLLGGGGKRNKEISETNRDFSLQWTPKVLGNPPPPYMRENGTICPFGFFVSLLLWCFSHPNCTFPLKKRSVFGVWTGPFWRSIRTNGEFGLRNPKTA